MVEQQISVKKKQKLKKEATPFFINKNLHSFPEKVIIKHIKTIFVKEVNKK